MSVLRGARSTSSTSLTDLATLLARAFLRLAERSHTGAVSYASDGHDSLDLSALSRPDESRGRTSRRAS
jgi:hypothetical protein